MRVIALLLLSIFSALPALAGGLQEGVKVRFVQNGKPFTATVTSIRSEREPLLIINPYGGMVRIPMREIRSIRATGKEQLLTLPWLFPVEKSFSLYEFSTLDGSRIVGAIDPAPLFEVDLGTNGKRRELSLDELELIEAQ